MFHQSNFVASAPPQPPAARPVPQAPPLDLSSVPPPLQAAAIEYDAFLNDLTWNSKQVINQLTTIAAENLPASDAISSVIEQRIFNAAPSMKLPFLYLMDSIVKNVGRRYLSRFAQNLFHTFTNAYAVAPPTTRISLRRMLGTWPSIYGFELVNAMTARADQIDAAPYGQLHPHHAPAARLPAQQPPSFFGQQPRVPMPRRVAEPRPQPPIPGLRSQPTRPPVIPPPSQMPPGGGKNLPLRSALRPAPPAPAIIPQPPPEFVELERMMSQVIRNASMGTFPSNHQLFTLNRMISTQLKSPSTHLQRNALIRFQQQLREISAAPRHRAAPVSKPPHVSAPPPAPLPPPQVPAPHVGAALSNLLRAMPQGLLHTVQSVAQPSRPLPSPVAVPRPSGAPRRAPDSVAPSYATAASAPLLTFSDLKGMSHHAGVRSLYTDLPHLSKSDGMRFATKEALREHLDWLFRQNRRKRGTKEQVVVGGQSRGWFETLDVFLGKVDPNAKPTNPSVNKKNVADENNDRTVSVVESKSENDICAACHEAFETFWDDDKHAWMLRECTKTDDDELYHVKCMQYTSLADDESADVSAQPQLEVETLKPEKEISKPALTNTSSNPQDPQPNTNSDDLREPSATTFETAAISPTAKEEPREVPQTPLVSQVNVAKPEPNIIARDNQGISHALATPYVNPRKHEPLLVGHADPSDTRGIPMMAMNGIPAGTMTSSVPGQDSTGKVIISKVPKWLAATTGIQVMHLEPARKDEPTVVSTSPPSGQKRKRGDSESGMYEMGSLNMNIPIVSATSQMSYVDIAEPQAKRQKECVPQSNA